MDLSSEDSLRLNVLMANAVAVRIDEGTMTVHGLSQAGEEARVKLCPNCNADRYVRYVRELLSSTVLGSPGGYPVYLKRWTRMGQASDMRLADLLMLGEPEAVVAVSGSPALTDELAMRAWWAMPDADNARRMLRCEAVVTGRMGPVLADFLLEFLPFEQEPQQIIESVRLVLQPGLIDAQACRSIWQRGRQKNVFMVGFLAATPDTLPEDGAEHPLLQQHQAALQALAQAHNPYARQLLRLLSAPGQAFVRACSTIMRKPSNQDVVVVLLDAIVDYLADVRISPFHYHELGSITDNIRVMLESDSAEEMKLPDELARVLAVAPQLQTQVEAMLLLAHTGEPVVRTIFAQTDSIGTVMRRKLEPVSTPLLRALSDLQGG